MPEPKPNLFIKKEKTGDTQSVKMLDVITKSENPEQQEWERQNIESIQKAVKTGKHDTVYYPASGHDVLRPLFAYDANEIIVLDFKDSGFTHAIETLQSAGINPKITNSPDGKKQEISFSIDGKNKKIIAVIGDARLYDPKDFNLLKVDVLHLYLPTGADTDIDEMQVYLKNKYPEDWHLKYSAADTDPEIINDPNSPKKDAEGNYKIAIEGLPSKFTKRNYEMVNEGGFFVFGEDQCQGTPHPVISLYEIAGLKEIEIVGRHPNTIKTNHFLSQEAEKTGYIYQKEKTVNPKIMDILNEASFEQGMSQNAFSNFEWGTFSYLLGGDYENPSISIQQSVENEYGKNRKIIESLAEKFLTQGVDAKLVEKYKAEALTIFIQNVSSLKNKLALLQTEFEIFLKERETIKITTKEVYERFGIVPNKEASYGMPKYLNTKHPLAFQMLFLDERKGATPEDQKEYLKTVRRIVKEFSETDFSSLKEKM